METLKAIAQSPAFAVFLGTLPLLGAIVLGLLQNDRRLNRIETKLDLLDAKVSAHGECLAIIETRLDGPRMVTR